MSAKNSLIAYTNDNPDPSGLRSVFVWLKAVKKAAD
jgi:hypothetical protein